MTPLKNEDDFEWYKRKLDVDSRYMFKHIGSPERYPCKVDSEQEMNNNSFFHDRMWHTFIYQKLVKCDHCGHEKLIWSDE